MDHMDFREIGNLVSEDWLSLEHLWKKCGHTIFPRCDSPEFYYQQGWKLRGKGCKNDCWPLQGTRFTLLRINPSHWLSLIKLFELSTSAGKASQEVHQSYKTTLRAYDILRRVLVEELSRNDEVLKGELEADEAYFGGKRKAKRGKVQGAGLLSTGS